MSLALTLGISSALAQADLSVAKDAKVDDTEGCKFVIFSVEVTNTGDETAQNVVATDTLDSRYVFSEDTTVGTPIASRSILADGATQLRWNIGDLEPGEDALLGYSAVAPLLNSDVNIANTVTADADNTAEVTASATVQVEATPINTICFETEGGGIGGPLLVQDGTGGPLPSTGINPILYLGFILPLALGIERWAWARERRK